MSRGTNRCDEMPRGRLVSPAATASAKDQNIGNKDPATSALPEPDVSASSAAVPRVFAVVAASVAGASAPIAASWLEWPSAAQFAGAPGPASVEVSAVPALASPPTYLAVVGISCPPWHPPYLAG